MAVKAPPPPPPAWSWTGFYVGGNIGGVVERAAGTSDFVDTSSGPPNNVNPQSNSFSDPAAIGGVQAGYDWQINQRNVLGVEVDWDWTNEGYSFCRQTNVLGLPCSDNDFGFELISSNTHWLATARARFGFLATYRLSLYGTGGAAWGIWTQP